MTRNRAALPITAALILSACSSPSSGDGEEAQTPQDAFFASLTSHCGRAFAGRLVSTDAVDADFADAEMVMHVKSCDENRIAIPFHVKQDGEWDRSRTWLITREEGGKLRLKHDHRHEDGSEDAVTMYGGDTVERGTARAQHFIVDPESIALFKEQGLTASVTNVWSVEVDPASNGADAGSATPQYAYQLKRTIEGGADEPRLFRVEFDLSSEVEAPPPAWGHE